MKTLRKVSSRYSWNSCTCVILYAGFI